MFATIAIILLIIWGAGLALHLLGGLIYLFLVLAVISAVIHFISGRGSNKPVA